MLDEMSKEQTAIYEEIKKGNNVIVDAIAGSGKSTCILSIAIKLENTQILQMTYNSMLRHEIKEKTVALGITNIQIHTFHSLAVKYYMPTAYSDTQLRLIILNKIKPFVPIPMFHILVIDEAQDMTFLYFQFMCKLCKDMREQTSKIKIQLFVLGDYMQGLYEFKGSDTRFLTFADKIWETVPILKTPHFVKCSLKISYRITHSISNFVNDIMLGNSRLSACKTGGPVVYFKRNPKTSEKYVVFTILSLLEQGYSPSDFFIIGSSVKGSKSVIRQMENVLVEHNIPCHVPMNEADKIDERVINGKVVFSTFHSVKGRQRKFVFIIGFDNNYFEYYARTMDPFVCPNTLYVGCTRASQQLYVFESDQNATDKPLPFLKISHSEMKKRDYIDFKGIPRNLFYDKKEPVGIVEKKRVKHVMSVSDMIKFIPESIIEEISPIVDRIFIKCSHKDDETIIEIPTVFKTKRGFHEDVSDLNGIVIPLMYFDNLMNKGCILRELINQKLMDTKPTELLFLKNKNAKLPLVCSTISDYLYLTNVYVAIQEHLYFKINQIDADEYIWLDETIIDECFGRMDRVFGEQLDSFIRGDVCRNLENVTGIEYTILNNDDDYEQDKLDAFLKPYFPEGDQYKITGRVDLVTEQCVWEIKCTSQLNIDHFLQVIIYAWLWRILMEDIENLDNIRDFKIFNIKTGEIFRLDATTEELNNIVISILKGKYSKIPIKTDEEFVEECKKITYC
jgi:hypothetical protein